MFLFHGPMLCSSQASSSPLCWSCGLIPNMHLPNYYETGWINLLDVESSASKYWPVSIYQVGITSVCYIYQKIVILMIPHTNFWWFRTRILKCLMIQHTNITYTHDDFHFKLNTFHSIWPILHPQTLLIILFRSLGPFLFKRKLVWKLWRPSDIPTQSWKSFTFCVLICGFIWYKWILFGLSDFPQNTNQWTKLYSL